jgi:hypothetical protein
MQTYDFDGFIKNQITDYLLNDLQTIRDNVRSNMHPGNAAYLMVGAICSGIEFIGTLVTEQKVIPGCDVCHKPEQIRNDFPFEHYCQDYLAKVDERYAVLGSLLRELVRNGIAHSFATKGRIGITRIGTREGTHLVRVTEQGLLVINANYFFDDFKESYLRYALPDISEGGSKRNQAVSNYAQIRDVQDKQIEQIMGELKDKLNNWPWEYQLTQFTAEVLTEVEESGTIS